MKLLSVVNVLYVFVCLLAIAFAGFVILSPALT